MIETLVANARTRVLVDKEEDAAAAATAAAVR